MPASAATTSRDTRKQAYGSHTTRSHVHVAVLRLATDRTRYGGRRHTVVMRWGRVLLVIVVLCAGTGAVRAADHPDSRTESIADGCARADLGLLGEAAVTMLAGGHPTPAASWVYVNGDSTPKS